MVMACAGRWAYRGRMGAALSWWGLQRDCLLQLQRQIFCPPPTPASTGTSAGGPSDLGLTPTVSPPKPVLKTCRSGDFWACVIKVLGAETTRIRLIMAIAPLCKICERRHWFHEPHVWADATGALRVEPVAEVRLNVGRSFPTGSTPSGVSGETAGLSSRVRVPVAISSSGAREPSFPPSSSATGAGLSSSGGGFDRKAYMRAYMRTYLPKWRARKKGGG
jgi:hypothetical protein